MGGIAFYFTRPAIMKLVAYLTEPASYTIDLVDKVHRKNDISVRYLWNKSFSNSHIITDESALFKPPIFISTYKLLRDDYRCFDAIVFNGYDSQVLVLWLYISLKPLKYPLLSSQIHHLKSLLDSSNDWLRKYTLITFKNVNLHGLARQYTSSKRII